MTAIELLKDALKGFGLNEVEMLVYAAALAQGPRRASTIARQAGLNRAYVYDVLTSLAQKGLVQEVLEGNVKHFTGTPPNQLLQLLEQRQREVVLQKERLQSVLPQLEELQAECFSQPSVRFLRGEHAAGEVLAEATAVCGRPIFGFFGASDSRAGALYQSGAGRDQRSNSRRVQQDCWYLGIGCGPSLQPLRSDELKLELRSAPAVALDFEVALYGSRVAVLALHGECSGIIFDSPRLAAGLADLHAQIWQLAAPAPAACCALA